jgi:hypothetical protein
MWTPPSNWAEINFTILNERECGFIFPCGRSGLINFGPKWSECRRRNTLRVTHLYHFLASQIKDSSWRHSQENFLFHKMVRATTFRVSLLLSTIATPKFGEQRKVPTISNSTGIQHFDTIIKHRNNCSICENCFTECSPSKGVRDTACHVRYVYEIERDFIRGFVGYGIVHPRRPERWVRREKRHMPDMSPLWYVFFHVSLHMLSCTV